MKRLSLEQAAKLAQDKKTGRMKWDELEKLVNMVKSGELYEAFVMAYNAGYYRGAVAAGNGKFPVRN